MRRLSYLLLLSILFLGRAVADEGMWLPSLIHQLNISEMQQMGFRLNADDIYNINRASMKDAIVALDRGSCTAEVISPDGLLLTNHHCAYGEIQKHSSVDHDYLRDGFWAMTREQELPNPGKSVTFLVSIEDVTNKVLAGVMPGMSEEERSQHIYNISRQLEREAKGNTHYETYVRSFFNDNHYHLFVVETFNDVRLVGVPPQALGKFGGDTDNWMWPRHTADFTLLRVYMGPDGKPAPYSEDNIPFKSRHFLPVSIKGIEQGDFAMVMGYPGSTDRYSTSFGVNYTMQVTNPVRIEVREQKLRIIGDYMSTSQKARIQYASKQSRSSNYYKYSIGQNKGLENLNVIAKKKAIEDEFTTWVNADQGRREKYGNVLADIAEAYSDVRVNRAMEYMAESMLRGPEIFMFANRVLPLYRLLREGNANPEMLEMIKVRLTEGLESFYKDFDAETDKKITAELLKLYADNNEQQFHPAFFSEVRKKYKGNYEKYVSRMFSKTIFDNEAELTKFLADPKLKTLENDMVFKATKDIFDKYRELTELAEEKSELLDRGNRLFVAGLMEMQPGRKFYPDANSTIRLTFGQVLEYEPRDGVLYKYYTTSEGYLEKEIPGDDEFDVPARMKELLLARNFDRYADKNGELVTCFITNNDITGGNSGSPVINANGELIGLAFDGNWEAMSGDIAFEPELQRCINVDIRFVLWVIDIYAGASHLVDEMMIVQ